MQLIYKPFENSDSINLQQTKNFFSGGSFSLLGLSLEYLQKKEQLISYLFCIYDFFINSISNSLSHIFTHIHKHTHTHTLKHKQSHTHTQELIHFYVCTQIHTCIQTQQHMQVSKLRDTTLACGSWNECQATINTRNTFLFGQNQP